MQVLFTWQVPAQLRQYFLTNSPAEAQLIFPEDVSEENLCRLAGDAEMIVGWRPSDSLLAAAKQLRLFQNPGAGVQDLVPLFQPLAGVALANCHGNTYFTAQHALALLLALSNKVIDHHRFMQQGVWRTGDKEGASIPLRDKTIGILGFGAVGQHFARFVSGFQVEVIACKRTPATLVPQGLSAIYTHEQLPEFLERCDMLVLALPLTPETKGMIGVKELAALGSEALLVNVSRGPVVDEAALYQALRNGVIAGAGLDVWYDYNPAPDSEGGRYPYHYPFHELSNVILSPHRGASPMDDLSRWDDVIENIRRLVEGQPFVNVVDLHLGY